MIIKKYQVSCNGMIEHNLDNIKMRYPKIHPITNKRIYSRGIYWEKYDIDDKKKYFYNDNGYYEKRDEEFFKIDKEYINMYDKTGKYKILAYFTEFDILCTCIENYNTKIKGYWFLAPEGYYWKWYHEKCYFNFEWVELEKINK